MTINAERLVVAAAVVLLTLALVQTAAPDAAAYDELVYSGVVLREERSSGGVEELRRPPISSKRINGPKSSSSSRVKPPTGKSGAVNFISLKQIPLVKDATPRRKTNDNDFEQEDNSIDDWRSRSRVVQVPSIGLNQFRSSLLVKTSNFYYSFEEATEPAAGAGDETTTRLLPHAPDFLRTTATAMATTPVAAAANNSLDYLHAKYSKFNGSNEIAVNFTVQVTPGGVESFPFEFNVETGSTTSAVGFGLIEKAVIGFILYALTVWTIIGNIFVCIALYTNKQLKQGGISNYLIGNLALSDLLLGVTVLPFSATFSTFQDWIFGSLWCDVWLSIDVLCCTASIWGLLVISLDRFIATNHPIIYRKQKNSLKVAIYYCTVSWLISIIISLAPLLMPDSGPEQPDAGSAAASASSNSSVTKISNLHAFDNGSRHECILFKKPSFVLLSSFGSFYLPLILMVLLYWRVFAKIRQQSKLFHNNAAAAAAPSRKNIGLQTEQPSKKSLISQISVDKSRASTVAAVAVKEQTEELLPKQTPEPATSTPLAAAKTPAVAVAVVARKANAADQDVDSISSEFNPTIQAASLISTAIATAPLAFSAPNSKITGAMTSSVRKLEKQQSVADTMSVSSKSNVSRVLLGKSFIINVTSNIGKKKSKANVNRSISNSEARVTKTLAIIMFCFVACWLPFFFTYNVRSLLRDQEQIPVIIMDMFIWLGYFNSALNPILYAILNRNFRIAFKDILACRCFKRF